MTIPTPSSASAVGADVSVRLSPSALERVQALISVGLAASVEDYVADSVRNRLAGFQDVGGPAAKQPEGDPKDWVTPRRRG